MRRILPIIALLLLIFISACRNEESDLGGKWVESDLRNVLTDTCTVKMSTMLFDSVNTSGDSACQVGYYEDATWGKISASCYVEYTFANFTPDEGITYKYDSLTLTMLYNKEYLGDTLKPFRMKIYELKDNIELNTTSGYLYNTSYVAAKTELMSTVSINPKPNKGQKVEVRLSDDLGKIWLNKLLNSADEFTTQDKFRQYFKGLAFMPDESSDKSIMGFTVKDSSMYVTLYYHKVQETAEAQTVKFIPSSTLYFNKVKHDRTGTPLEEFNSKTNEIVSSKLKNLSFVQGLTGFYTKIEFPYLNNLLLQGEMVSIESATLYLYPVKDSYGTFSPLPSSLSLYTANENNVTGDAVTDQLGTSVQDGSLVVDNVLNKNTYYSFDLTSFLQTNLGAIGYDKQNLQLVLPSGKIASSYESVIFGDMKHSVSPVKALVRYKIYKSY